MTAPHDVAVAVAAAATLLAATALVGCGEKEEHVRAVSAAEARALVTAGLGALDATDSTPGLITVRSEGPVLRIRTAPLPTRQGLLRELASFDSLRARIVPFCPKPAILGCRPALQATGALRRARAFGEVVDGLRRLAERRYEQRTAVSRSRQGDVEILTSNGELLGAARREGRMVRLSFGGASIPARAGAPLEPGKLVVEAGPDALAAVRGALDGRARGAIGGVRRLEFAANL